MIFYFVNRKKVEANLRSQGFKFDRLHLHFFTRKVTIWKDGQKFTCHLKLVYYDYYPNLAIGFHLLQKQWTDDGLMVLPLGIGDLDYHLKPLAT